MSPKISVVIPCGGNDPARDRNFYECIGCIRGQIFRDYEVIVVEQSLDGKFYKKRVTDFGFKHICIKDPENRGFNLSWCRNVGAKEASGEILVLMDSDFVFENEYFSAVSLFNGMFAAGAETYYWCNNDKATVEWLRFRKFDIFRRMGGEPRDSVFKFRSMTRGCGYGAILVYNRDWFWNVMGGYNENFFKYGWEDKAATETIKFLLDKNDETMDRIPYEAAHLSHRNKDFNNLDTNESLFNEFSSMDQNILVQKIKEAGVGKKTHPSTI